MRGVRVGDRGNDAAGRAARGATVEGQLAVEPRDALPKGRCPGLLLLMGTRDARERLRAMVETNDGFEIARRDLEIRGPGEFLGARQSGAPLLRFADLTTDTHLLEWARALAPAMLDKHPQLARRHIARWLGGKSEYLKA